MLTKMFGVVVLAGLVVLATAAWYQLSGHHVPAGQPLLADLRSDSLDSLKTDFNGSAESIRIVLLLSPT